MFLRPQRGLTLIETTIVGGFSLIEMVLVLALVSVMIAISLPLYRGYLDDRSLQNAAHLIQADLRLAQQTAVSNAGSGPRVEMCFRSNGYDIYAVDYMDQMARTGAQVGRTVKVANTGQEIKASIVMTPDPSATDPCLSDAARQAVVFSGAGAPVSFDDASAKIITLTINGRTYRVTIAPDTGRVTVGR